MRVVLIVIEMIIVTGMVMVIGGDHDAEAHQAKNQC